MSYTKRAFMAMKYPETHGPQPGDEEEGAAIAAQHNEGEGGGVRGYPVSAESRELDSPAPSPSPAHICWDEEAA